MLTASGAAAIRRNRTQPVPLADARLETGTGPAAAVLQPRASFHCPTALRRFTLCPRCRAPSPKEGVATLRSETAAIAAPLCSQ